MSLTRRIPGDWYDGTIPVNVFLDPEAHVDSTFCFSRFRSRLPTGLILGRGTAVYKSTRFDIGPEGQVEIGEFAMINGAEFICDGLIRIGAYSLISWNVILLDNYRIARDSKQRRVELQRFLIGGEYPADRNVKPIEIGKNVWLGHNVVVMPGTSIGEGSIIGARSTVATIIPPYSVAAGNPARVIRTLQQAN